MDPTTTEQSHTFSLFMLTFGVLIVLFLGSNLFVAYRLHALDAAVSDITENASPSVMHLSGARAALPRIILALDGMIDDAAAGRAPVATALADARHHFDAEVAAYLSLPAYPGERGLWFSVARDTGRLDQLIGEATQQIERHDLIAARETQLQLEGLAEIQTVQDVMRVIALNADQVRARAAMIRRVEKTSIHVMVSLDTASVLLALAIATVTYRSITQYERKLRLMRVQAVELASELDDFAVRVAHDIRSPLTVAVLELQSVSNRLSHDARLSTSIERSRRSIGRAVGVVDGLLAFARSGATPDAGARADAGAVLADLLAELSTEANAAGVDLQMEPCPPTEVTCDPELLGVAVANLVRNAIKYLSASTVRRVRVRLVDRGTSARIEVEDTGPGVPDAVRDTLFVPYVRGPGVTQSGLGLGLATVKRICSRHGGRVGSRDAQSGGSVFWLELPKVPSNSAIVHAGGVAESAART